MPLHDFLCLDCGSTSEVLLISTMDRAACGVCGSENVKKLLSPHAGYSGTSKGRIPGPGDTACCGTSPAEAGCSGPGSCCGKGPR